jgi:hypothetical protein
LDNQSDSGKKQNAIRKPRRETTQELQSGQFGLRMAKMVQIKPIRCVFAKLFYSSGYTAPEMHHQQANIIQTTRAGAWPVSCVADLVRASSLAGNLL